MQGESGGTYMHRLRSWAYPPPLVTLGPSTSSSAVLYSRCIGRWRRPTAITNKQTNKQTLYGFCYQPAKKGIHQKQVDSLRSVSFLYWYKRVSVSFLYLQNASRFVTNINREKEKKVVL